MQNPVGWFEIYVDDMPRARAFYEAVFKVSLAQLPMDELEMWGFPMDMSAPGASGALVRMEGVKAGCNSTMVYFGCDDCATEAARVPAAGGTVQRPKFSIGEYGFIAIVQDTEGNTIGLHSMI
ncbi:VOC family protein [Chitinibacteraceae bacterium HSL-7]